MLQKIGLGNNSIGEAGARGLAEAIDSGHLQHLQDFDLSNNSIDEAGVRSLVEAIRSRRAPRLNKLDIHRGYKYAIGEIDRAIADALRELTHNPQY